MSQDARRRSGLHKAYVATVFVLGLAALVDALYTLQISRVPLLWIGLALLTIVSDSVTSIKIPGLTAHVSPSEIFLFLIVLLFGGAPAVATVALGGLAFSLKQELSEERREKYDHAAFNLAEPALSMWIASKVCFWSSGIAPLWMKGASVAQVALPALAMTAVYLVLNSGLNAVAEAGSTGKPPFPLWRKYFQDVSANYFSNASIAVVLAVNLSSGDVSDGLKVLLVIAPLVITPYYNLALSSGRLNDQDRHVSEMEALTDKLVETLGMTAEAQDPVKSLGHIRRVRKFAMRLAASMGIGDAQERRAISYAGLLHDYGKTKIPEHILNKPGKLTASEYDIVKTHAAIGADMVSRIGFDLPLVPLIRHHHENWDGTGYPDGIKGEAIPRGARIISVVDCYDALREKRRYRPAWTHEQAMAIVRERAGTMYDPGVVRAFESIQDEVRREPYEEDSAEAAGAALAAGVPADLPVDGAQPLSIEVRLSDTETIIQLHEQLSRLDPASGVSATCDVVSRHLLRIAPAGLIVFYRRDEAADAMVAAYASGRGEALARGVHVPLGDKVTGWVGATGQSRINADPALDLDERFNGLEPRFKSLLSVPLTHAGTASGVVTLYAAESQAFRDEQQQAIELVGPAVATAFERAVRLDETRCLPPAGDAVPGPAAARSLEGLLALDGGGEAGRTRAVLCVKNEGDGAVMLHATIAVNKATRRADLIFRQSGDSLVVLMRDSDLAAGRMVVQRIAEALPPDLAPPTSPGSLLRFGFACSPQDGELWKDLLSAAQRRLAHEPAPAPAVHERGGQPCQA